MHRRIWRLAIIGVVVASVAAVLSFGNTGHSTFDFLRGHRPVSSVASEKRGIEDIHYSLKADAERLEATAWKELRRKGFVNVGQLIGMNAPGQFFAAKGPLVIRTTASGKKWPEMSRDTTVIRILRDFRYEATNEGGIVAHVEPGWVTVSIATPYTPSLPDRVKSWIGL